MFKQKFHTEKKKKENFTKAELKQLLMELYILIH